LARHHRYRDDEGYCPAPVAEQRARGGEIDVLEHQPGEQPGDDELDADRDPLHPEISLAVTAP
jgi:hypothetical protein